MPPGVPNPREVARYYALAQVGLEMVAPIALGVWLDGRYGWSPWATVIGTVLGLVGGFAHLLLLLKRFDDRDRASRNQGPQ